MSNTKNLTLTLTKDDYEELENLVTFFQSQSIAKVTKSDVVKYMTKQMKRTVAHDLLKEYENMLTNAEKENAQDNKS
ncbi:hypothetical protein CN918_31665 [Priestia megaterium]|nr:hypothetical protein CN918_31665 [Priestia megaterium]